MRLYPNASLVAVLAASLFAASLFAVGGCGSRTAPSGSASPSGSVGVPRLSVRSFTNDFSEMSRLRPLAGRGKGKVAVLLPDTVSSARYTEFDAPYLRKSFQQAGLPPSQVVIQNAHGSDSTQLSDAMSDIADGASVLVLDPLDSGVGARIEAYAKAHGVPVIDYDRLTVNGSRSYYVGFDNVEVGRLIGRGLVSCVQKWGVQRPEVIVMKGDPTDHNALLFARGYDGVLAAKFGSGGWTKAAAPAGTWDPPTAAVEFQQAFAVHPGVDAVLAANDATAAPIISYLKTRHVGPQTFPVTGQDATLVGLRNILAGYQCGTAYKPIYQEAQATAALALSLRAGATPPPSLVNGTTKDPESNVEVRSVLLTPQWVTAGNMLRTVVADKVVSLSRLCAGGLATYCTRHGIK